jgi:hypothetical protein
MLTSLLDSPGQLNLRALAARKIRSRTRTVVVKRLNIQDMKRYGPSE